MKTEIIEDDCPFCGKITKQRYDDQEHERDTAYNMTTCLECQAYKLGLNDKWTKRTVTHGTVTSDS